MNIHYAGGGSSSSNQSVQGSRGGWALPSSEAVPMTRHPNPNIREVAGSSDPQPPPSRMPTAQNNSRSTVVRNKARG